MPTDTELARTYLELLVETLDIPPSLYDRAIKRHHSLGDWLCRNVSRLKQFNPHVSPRGSFRHGTVVRPLFEDAEYDLDNVRHSKCSRRRSRRRAEGYTASKWDYAQAHGMLAPLEEKNRCWRRRYADREKFHLDSLPSRAEEEGVVVALRAVNVPEELAKRAIAITDRRHAAYATVTMAWPTSNPRGFARWLEAKMGPLAEARRLYLVDRRFYATVEDVPTYELKTPLQQSIQLLKRHRDAMFADNPELAPISMIRRIFPAMPAWRETDVQCRSRHPEPDAVFRCAGPRACRDASAEITPQVVRIPGWN